MLLYCLWKIKVRRPDREVSIHFLKELLWILFCEHFIFGQIRRRELIALKGSVAFGTITFDWVSILFDKAYKRTASFSEVDAFGVYSTPIATYRLDGSISRYDPSHFLPELFLKAHLLLHHAVEICLHFSILLGDLIISLQMRVVLNIHSLKLLFLFLDLLLLNELIVLRNSNFAILMCLQQVIDVGCIIVFEPWNFIKVQASSSHKILFFFNWLR